MFKLVNRLQENVTQSHRDDFDGKCIQIVCPLNHRLSISHWRTKIAPAFRLTQADHARLVIAQGLLQGLRRHSTQFSSCSHHVLISERFRSSRLTDICHRRRDKTDWRNEMPEKSVTPFTVLHLRFKLRVPPAVLLAQSREAATIIASVEGLIWKIWVLQEEEFEMGGVYLFANRETAEAYLNHPVTQAVRSNPAVVSTRSQLWDVERALSALTWAPLRETSVQSSEAAPLVAGGQ